MIFADHIISEFSFFLNILKIRRIYRLLLLTVLGFSIPFINTNAQTGPGGVGNSSSNRLWLKADTGVFRDAGTTPASNGISVQRWNDFSGNNNNANQATNSFRPVFQSGVVNGEPAIQFSGNMFIDPGPLGIAGTGGFCYIIVFKVNPGYEAGSMNSSNGDFIIDRYLETDELASLKIVSTNKYGFQKRTDSHSGIGGPESVTPVNTSSFTLIDYMRERTIAYRLFINGSLEASIADGDGNITPPKPRIGRHYDQAGNGLNGYISELLIYNYRLNNAQINIVNSYLAAKYGLTVANDKYSWDATNKNEVAGIGREDDSNLHTEAISGGILNISNPSSLDNGDYLLFGHNKGSVSSWSSSESPSPTLVRLKREWRLNKTGEVGTVTLGFKSSALPPPPSGSCGKYYLLADADGNFSTGATQYELALVGDYYQKSAMSINDGDYVTIALRTGPGANITPDPAQICAGGSFTLNGNPTGGSGTFITHSWTGNTSPLSAINIQNPVFSTNTANSYNLTYTVTDDNGCTGSDNITVAVIPDPVAPGLTRSPDEVTICSGTSLTVITVPGTGGTGTITDEYRYSTDNGVSWSSWSTVVPVFNAVTGTNIIESRRTATGNDCSTSSSAAVSWNVVNEPSWSNYSFPVTTICHGGQVTFSVLVQNNPGGTVKWIKSTTPGGSGTEVFSPDIPTTAGTYYYRPQYISAGTGCTLSDGTETTVTVLQDPSWNAITPPAATICIGGSVSFSATLTNAGNGTVQWVRSTSPGGSGTIVLSPDEPPSTGTFYYRPQYLPGYAGCNLIDGQETIVTVKNNPVWDAIVNPETHICAGGSVTFSATILNQGSGSVQWIRSTISGGPGTVVGSPDVPPGGTYYYRPHFVPGIDDCILDDGTETVVAVLPDPQWNLISFPVNAICPGGSVSFSATLTNPGNGTIQWIRSDSPGGTGIQVSSPDTPGSAGTYYYRPHYMGGYGGCGLADGTEKQLTVHSFPELISTLTPGAICSGAVFSYTPQSSTTGTSFGWTRAAVTGITPATAGSGNGDPGETLTNTTTEPLTVRYVYTLTANSCTNPSTYNVDVTVNPDVIADLPDDLTVCNESMTGSLTFTSPITGGTVTYSWINNEPSIGLGSDGIGNIESFKALSTGDAPLVATIEVTPHFTAGALTCDGPAKTFTITVNPTAQVNKPENQVVCNDEATLPVLFTTTNSGTYTTFTWTNDQPAIGLAESGEGDISGFIALNAGDSPVTANIIVTPHFTYAGLSCEGPSKTFSIVVDPTAKVEPSTLTQNICNDSRTNIIIGSPSTFSSGPVTFNYTATSPGGVTGFVASAIGLSKGHIITDLLHNPTSEPQTVTYIIVPVNATGCASAPATVIVTVLPEAGIIQIQDVILCNGETSGQIDFETSSSGGDVTYSWTNSEPSIGLPSSGTGNLPSFTATNSGDPFITAVISVIPHFTLSGQSCDGSEMTFNISVNPTPRIFPIPVDTIQCDSSLTRLRLRSPSTFADGNISFKFTASSDGGITGFTPAASGLPENYVISEQLVNLTDSPKDVIYNITPVSPAGCDDGPSHEVKITVNPTPVIFPVPPDTVQCDSSLTFIKLRSSSTFTSGTISFKFSASAAGGVTGFTPSATGLQPDHIIEDKLINTTDIPQQVIYRVTPVSPAGCHDGPSVNVSVTVNPTPRIFPIPGNKIQCDSTSVDVVIQSPSVFTKDLVKFNLTASAPAGLTGFTEILYDLPNNSIIADNLVNTTDVPLDVTYNLVPVSGVSCNQGKGVTFSVRVNPTPRAVPVNIKPAICFGDQTEIELISPTVMTSGDIKFDYSFILPGAVTSNGTAETDKINGDVISYWYRNYNDTVQSVNFLITPKVSGLDCPAGPVNIQEVRVHPEPARGINLTKPFTCLASSGRAALRAEISRGAGPYNLIWTGPVGYFRLDSLEIKNLYSGIYWLNVTDNLGCMGDTLIEIKDLSVNPRLILLPKTTGFHVSCNGGNDGMARIYVKEGGEPPFTYRLVRNETETVYEGLLTGIYNTSDPSTFRICIGLRAGEYKLIISDLNKCEVYREDELTEPPPINIEFIKSNYNGSNVTCLNYSDGSVEANVTGGNGNYAYFWYPESGSLSVENTGRILAGIPAGKYYLRITDGMGCEKTDSVNLINPPGMVLSGSSVSHSNDGIYQISCNGAADGFINLTVTGGLGPYSFLWVGPGGYTSVNKDISGLKAGTYTCTVTDINGCILMPLPLFTLEEPDILTISTMSSLSVDEGHNINCHGGAGSIDAIISGGSTGNYSYDWTTPDGSGIVSGREDQNALTAGSYHLVVTDRNGCIAETNVLLTEPSAMNLALNPTHITCQSSGFDNGSISLTVTGGISPYNYNWSNGEVLQEITGLTEGYYSVIVTDANGCHLKDSVRINLPQPLAFDKVISMHNGYNITCFGKSDGSIQVNPTSGLAPYTFNWEGPGGFTGSSNDLSGLKPGRYTVIITDRNFCMAYDTIDLTEAPGKISMVITASSSVTGNTNINCKGESTGTVDLEAFNNAGPVSYIWADGLVGSSRQGLKAGSYKVVITDSNNCQTDSLITLSEPVDSLHLSFEITKPFCTDMPDGQVKLTVTGGTGSSYSYLWSDNTTGQNLTGGVSGSYSVKVTDLNNCTIEKSVLLEPENEFCLEIPNAISPNGDLTNDVWNIGLKELYPQIEIKIFNRWGELIWRSEEGYPIPWDGRSNGSVLPIDSYHYLINLHNGSKPIIGHVTIVK